MKNLIIVFIILASTTLYAQMQGLHGEFSEYRNGLHAGNQFRTTFYNDGHYGKSDNSPEDIGGEWPINSGHSYMWDGNPFVGSEVIDTEGELKHIVSGTISLGGNITTGQQGPTGEWWTFLPLPKFANPDTNKVAMSKWPWSWPNFWPDKFDDQIDPGWPGKWNGYFGKDVYNADEESYFVIDDYQNKEFAFYPDSTDLNRRGLGMRVTCRGLQWSNALVEDALFTLYDIENIGTTEHDKMVFGFKIGSVIGALVTESGDGWDDSGAYDVEEDIAYMFDNDLIGTNGWYPIGYFGGAFLESPGNHFDGIDNDADASSGPGPTITESMFAPFTIHEGDDIALIDYKTFERDVTKMPKDTVFIYYQDLVIKIWPGKEIVEIPNNLIDDNLNGLIDENNGSTFGEPPNEITTYLYVGAKYIDYFTGEGKDNLLLDERRDDGIDNDSDWNPLFDDVGLDGVANTGDTGEADGIPTSGAGTDLPGEPHIDKTDIDESDMLGLTSFTLFLWEDIPLFEDELLWKAMIPGYLDDILQNNNTELLYGSGYFPMKPNQRERFSMGLIAGDNLDDLFENKSWVSKAYSENYNFSKAPIIPTLKAFAGDNQVTLYWDELAEKSVDPIGGLDFEGYRIYRSTDPGFNDMQAITDSKGSVIYRKPLAQFDLINEFSGNAEARLKGQSFWLGENTGLVHSFVDTSAVNGYKYYYAVTSYDHGLPPAIPPTECSKFISISTSGEIDKGKNVVIVRPQAPSAGYISSDTLDAHWMAGSTTNGKIGFKIVDPTLLRNATYRVTFEDTLMKSGAAMLPYTLNFTLTDITNFNTSDTLINKSTLLDPDDELPLTHGFRLRLKNYPELIVNEKLTKWNRDNIYAHRVRLFKKGRLVGWPKSSDYRIEFGEPGMKMSTAIQGTSGENEVNFRIYNITEGKEIEFGFKENDGNDGIFSAYTDGRKSDLVIFLEKDEHDSLICTWQFELFDPEADSLTENPQPGDYLTIIFDKPFLSNDVYEFKTKAQTVDEALAENQITNIKVVPNPYIVSNSWEPQNPYSTGRGPRELHFIHLPPKCTIKIFNIRGQLVRKIEHDNDIWNGTEIWDMQTKDQLDIAYGIYIYHVDAGDMGQKIGKFAVIK